MTLDEWAVAALNANIAHDGKTTSDALNGRFESIAKNAFDLAEAMKNESRKRNDSYVNQQLKDEK